MELCPTQRDEEKKSLGIYLCWMDYTISNFTVTFTLINGEKVLSLVRKTHDEPGKGTGRGWPTFISHDDLFAESQNLIVDDVLTLEFEVTIVNKHSPTFIDVSFISARTSRGLKVAAIASVKDCSKQRKAAQQQEVQRLGSDLLWRKQNSRGQKCHFRSMSNVCCYSSCSHGRKQFC